MADEKKSNGSLLPEVIKADSQSLAKPEGQPLRLSGYGMRQRKKSLERETELIHAATKNQEARLNLHRSVERLKEDRLSTILRGDAAQEEAEYLAASSAATNTLIEIELAEERATTAKLREQNEQERLRAEIAENRRRREQAEHPSPPLNEDARRRAAIATKFREKLGARYTEQEIRQHAASEIAAVQQRAGDRPLTESEEREIKNISDAMNALLNEI